MAVRRKLAREIGSLELKLILEPQVEIRLVIRFIFTDRLPGARSSTVHDSPMSRGGIYRTGDEEPRNYE